MTKTKKIMISLAVFFLLNSVCKTLTSDLSFHYLVTPADSTSQWNIPEQPSNLASLLSQEYSYLGKGKQAYVFVSKDQEHVLKLFKLPSPTWNLPLFGKTYKVSLSKLPFAKKIFSSLNQEQEKKTRDLEFQSYVNSFSLLKEETKLEYLHLASTNTLHQTLKIYDKIGIVRFLDADSSCFLIQKKTDLLYPKLEKLINAKETEKAKYVLDKFVALSFRFMEQGIVNPTTVDKNFGCLGLEPVQIDVGRVLRKEDLDSSLSLEDRKIPLNQIYKSTNHMKKWLEKIDPTLCTYLKETEALQLQKYKELHEQSL